MIFGGYAVEGEGEPVGLISGTGMPPEQWQLGLGPDLVTRGYRVITFANRGIPPSDCPPAPYTIADLAADTAGHGCARARVLPGGRVLDGWLRRRGALP